MNGAETISLAPAVPWYDTNKVPYIQASPSLHRAIRFVHADSLPTQIVHTSSWGKPYALYAYCVKVSSSCPTTAASKNKVELAVLQLWNSDAAFQAQLLATGYALSKPKLIIQPGLRTA